ncbi:MAG: hypothetical protein KA479_06730 [Saprospiraceae bacterium]|nr:hypothetical protein [Saprospiraceae bacterium]
MAQFIRIFLFCMGTLPLAGQSDLHMTPFELDTSYSASAEEAHAWYSALARNYPEVMVGTFGISDGQLPLYEVVIGRPESLDPESARSQGKSIVLINNAIHPGEPCGVDASMILARQLVSDPTWQPILDQVTIVIIPYYNVDGGRNRSATYRANQNGPRLQGFRGNGKNLDLNRDFLKTDSYNTRSFVRLFHRWDPDLFIDTHTSNGADYSYTMTLIPTQPDKLPPALAAFQQEKLLPYLYEGMQHIGQPMSPYVHGDHAPDKGLKGFLDLPRYSTGYAALFQCLGFMTEAHMLKPFSARVDVTHLFLQQILTFAATEGPALQAARATARAQVQAQSLWPVQWQVDSARSTDFTFAGYEEAFAPSKVSGRQRTYYDQTRPYTRVVPYYPHYESTVQIQKPKAYIIKQSWRDIIERLQLNQITILPLERDTLIAVTSYRLGPMKTATAPYEGHYPHSQVNYDSTTTVMAFHAGDMIVPTDQPGIAFLIQALEPKAPDSWFAWNFFDPILNQKEYYSDYLWEDLAAYLLESNTALRQQFEEAKRNDAALAADPQAQLDWVYHHSDYYEDTHRVYPVYRIEY